jgi:hypothetical protein
VLDKWSCGEVAITSNMSKIQFLVMGMGGGQQRDEVAAGL